jgi:hypothetical protein
LLVGICLASVVSFRRTRPNAKRTMRREHPVNGTALAVCAACGARLRRSEQVFEPLADALGKPLVSCFVLSVPSYPSIA